MSRNLNCAAIGYDCAFSITAEDGQQDFMVETVERHAGQAHPELVDDAQHLKPAVRSKLLELLTQAKYSDLSN